MDNPLEKIEAIVSDDFCNDLSMKLADCEIIDPDLKIAAQKLLRIYRIAHSHNPAHSCFDVHDDWRKEESKPVEIPIIKMIVD